MQNANKLWRGVLRHRFDTKSRPDYFGPRINEFDIGDVEDHSYRYRLICWNDRAFPWILSITLRSSTGAKQCVRMLYATKEECQDEMSRIQTKYFEYMHGR